MQYHTILFNTIQLHAIPFNIQEHMILYNLCNTMQYDEWSPASARHYFLLLENTFMLPFRLNLI